MAIRRHKRRLLGSVQTVVRIMKQRSVGEVAVLATSAGKRDI